MTTTAVIPPKSPSEVFTIVRDHLIKQGCKSTGSVAGHPVCAYRGDNGTKCAAGVLIRDEDYLPSMEGWGVGTDGIARILARNGVTCINLVSDLQECHDKKEVSDWPVRLEDIRVKHYIEAAPLSL